VCGTSKYIIGVRQLKNIYPNSIQSLWRTHSKIGNVYSSWNISFIQQLSYCLDHQEWTIWPEHFTTMGSSSFSLPLVNWNDMFQSLGSRLIYIPFGSAASLDPRPSLHISPLMSKSVTHHRHKGWAASDLPCDDLFYVMPCHVILRYIFSPVKR